MVPLVKDVANARTADADKNAGITLKRLVVRGGGLEREGGRRKKNELVDQELSEASFHP